MQKTKLWNIPFLVLLLGAFITVLNIGVTGVAIPSIARALNATGLQIHFIADGLTLTLSSLVLLTGAIGDKYGRKRLFLAGSILMLIATTASAYSSTATVLIFWRMVGGIATAMLFPTTLSMISILFPDQKQKILAIGIWSGIAAGGAAIAPVISGTLLQFFPWGSVYLISSPLTLTAILLGFFFLPEFKIRNSAPIDYLGGILSIIMISFLLFGIVLIPVTTIVPFVPTLFIISLVTFVLFLFRELTTSHPLLDIRTFKNIRFSVACFVITLVAFAQLGVMFLAQQFVQNVLGYTTLQAGLSGVPLSIAVLIMSPLSAKIDTRWGSKKTIALGLILVGLGFFTALFWTVHSSYIQIFLSYLTIGIGLGLTMTPSTNAIMNSLPEEKAGIASALNDLTRDFGNSLGIAVNGSIAAVSYASVLKSMYDNIPPAEKIPIAQTIAQTITSSLSGALSIAQQYPSVDAQKLVIAAKQAFLDGQIHAMMLSVILCIVATCITLVFMPEKQTEPKNR